MFGCGSPRRGSKREAPTDRPREQHPIVGFRVRRSPRTGQAAHRVPHPHARALVSSQWLFDHASQPKLRRTAHSIASMATDLNAQMVERQKTSRAIRSPSVERAFRTVLRHHFLPGVGLDLVYSGNAIVTRSDPAHGITSSSSEVAITAPMLEALQLERDERVLEIGAGTGYNAALLDELVGPNGSVTSIDNQASVADDARAHLGTAGRTRVHVVVGDGYAGWKDAAPYDRIIATASVRDIPLAWRDQLREGGLLVVPLRFGPGAQIVATFRRRGERLDSVSVVGGGFMPLRTDDQVLEEPLKIATDLDVAIASPR